MANSEQKAPAPLAVERDPNLLPPIISKRLKTMLFATKPDALANARNLLASAFESINQHGPRQDGSKHPLELSYDAVAGMSSLYNLIDELLYFSELAES